MTPTDRADLRRQLLKARQARGASREDDQRIAHHLMEVLQAIEPDILGLYWPIQLEFNPLPDLLAHPWLKSLTVALPWSVRSPISMSYRQWDRQTPSTVDDMGIASATGPVVVPDVVVVPCVGFNRDGYRLGYGGGYFDRYLAQYPHITSIGLAHHSSEVAWEVAPHDLPLTLIVTEQGVYG